MNCPQCHGTGRNIGHVTIHMGKKQSITLPEINGLCATCHGQRVIHCCEGDREQAMLNAAEECNPN